MKKSLLSLVAVLAVASAQYTREFQSPNLGQNVWGASYGYDIDDDGKPNMWARTTGQVIVYSSTYSVYWAISVAGYDYPYLTTPRDVDGDGLIKPVNMDGDPAGEVVVTGYRISGSDLYGKVKVYDASSKQLEWESAELAGFSGRASVDDIDGDNKHEIIITRYNYTAGWGYVEVYGYTGAGAGERPGFGLKSRQVMVQPTVSSGVVEFWLDSSGATRLAVFDASGREVRELLNAVVPAGQYRLNWDGCDRSGARLASGTYIYQLQTRGRTESGRVILTQ